MSAHSTRALGLWGRDGGLEVCGGLVEALLLRHAGVLAKLGLDGEFLLCGVAALRLSERADEALADEGRDVRKSVRVGVGAAAYLGRTCAAGACSGWGGAICGAAAEGDGALAAAAAV